MKVTAVIPWYYAAPGKDKLLRACVASLKGHDELIIVANDGLGICKAVNIGFQSATGDYICVLNDDLVLTRGTLRDLCHPDYVTVPHVESPIGGASIALGTFACYPRWVYDEVGGYDENFRYGYFEDDDMIKRLEEAGIERRRVRAVRAVHPKPSSSLSVLAEKNPDINFWNENEAYFVKKWGAYSPISGPPPDL
jgi:N-acetylglucosaminyl-diphospho-decaprenol L-rhamnosyltransferase